MRTATPLALSLLVAACSGSGGPSSEIGAAVRTAPPAGSYTLFESLQVRPLALSPSGRILYALNTPASRLEVYYAGRHELEHVTSVAVGLEPVAVAVRDEREVWVVNHLSDSVSVVRFDDGEGRVVRTLHVGDEPRDIVFGGPNHDRAFITTAHRGQNTGDAYDQQTPGVGRCDVWVFDADNLGDNAGGNRLTKLTFFADTPRALAVTPDGNRVYAAAFFSGNQTTAVSPYAVETVYKQLGKQPPLETLTVQTPIGPIKFPQPQTGLIVKYKVNSIVDPMRPHWYDAYGVPFDPFVRISLPDLDVFAIDASGPVPVAVPPQAGGVFAHVGTTLFNMAVNPQNGKVYVTNTDARNDVRFEGHAAGFTSVRGHITDSQISVLDPTNPLAVVQTKLNPHIDYTQDGNPAEKALSVAFPMDVTVSSDGATLLTVGQGSGKLAIYNTADIEAGHVTPSLADQVVLAAGGPSGVVLDEQHGRAYVLTRFDDGISVVDVGHRKELAHVKMNNPEPPSVTNGRQYLYDANFTSQHGDTACASCHIGGDFDGLAWDLGNPGGIPLRISGTVRKPDGTVANSVPGTFTIPIAFVLSLVPQFEPEFRAYMQLKGPMTTQSLRGMDNHGSMHWRGDRNGAINQDGSPVLDAMGNPVPNAQPNSGIFDEVRAFMSFNVAFPGLLGNSSMLSQQDMLDFTTFILQQTYPPNPNRALDNSLDPEEQVGAAFYFNHAPNGTPLPSDRFHECNGCHVLDRNGNAGSTAKPGFFGTDGKLSFEFETQVFKVPHLRNMYQKVGMFGSSPDTLQPGSIILTTNPANGKPIIFPATRGFGFNHDGVLGTIEHFLTGQVFLQADGPVHLATGQVAPPNPFGIPFVDPNGLVTTPPTIKPVDKGFPPFLPPGTPGVTPDPFGFKLRDAIVRYLLAFDTNEAPIVGQQITLDAEHAATAGPRLDLLEARANTGECDLVARSGDKGWLFQNGSWLSASGRSISDARLRHKATDEDDSAITFTATPRGGGPLLAFDRSDDD